MLKENDEVYFEVICQNLNMGHMLDDSIEIIFIFLDVAWWNDFVGQSRQVHLGKTVVIFSDYLWIY